MGIGTYNEECRSIVMRYSKDWERIVHRLGRWIDFEVGAVLGAAPRGWEWHLGAAGPGPGGALKPGV